MLSNLKLNIYFLLFLVVLCIYIPFYLFSINANIYLVLFVNFFLHIFFFFSLYNILKKINYNFKKYIILNLFYITISTLLINKFSNWGYRDYNSILFTILFVQLFLYINKSILKKN